MFRNRRSISSKLGIVFASLFVMSLLASCALPGPVVPPTMTPAFPTSVPPISPTPTSLVLPGTTASTDTPVPPTAAVPTDTPLPTNTPVLVLPTSTTAANVVPAAGSIAFTPGTTAGVVQGTAQAGQVINYTISGAASQALVLIVSSANSDVHLGVFAPDGTMLLNPANKFIRWQTLLPQSGLYTVQIVGGATAENFTLTAKISEVVNFAAGATSATLNGTTTNGFLHSYSFSAQAGQTMTASLNVPASTATLDVFGIVTGVILSPANKVNSWTGVLPQTQVYVVEVIPTGGQVINYSLTVSITTPGSTSSSGNILFGTGTTQATVAGTVQAGQVLTYTINAGANLPMVLDVASDNSDVTLGVIQPDGVVLLNNANKWIHWQWMLPESGLYRIQVVGGATNESFSLTVRIPQMVNFAAGASSATLNGTTTNGLVFSYGLNCKANQTMTVSLNLPNTTAYLDIFGVSSGTLLNATAKATSWTVTLPVSEDYLVEVIPVGGQVVNYSLTISVTSPTTSVATPIVFSPGTTAGVVAGTVNPGQIISYTVSAVQWQPMVLSLESPNHDVTLGLFEANGATVVSPGNHWIHWQGLLPQTEVFTVQVNGGATTEAYTLTVKIAQRITFNLGQSSITINGTTTNGYVQSYAFKCNTGQTMTVTINLPNTTAYLDVYGIATGSLLSPVDKATSWTGVLPSYQDYIVEVVPASGQLVSYTITVTVH